MKTRKRLTWKKRNERWQSKAYDLNFNGERLAVVQELGRFTNQWFWYGMGENTCHNPVDLETAKSEAKAFILSRLP
jgi:hypothetical protein